MGLKTSSSFLCFVMLLVFTSSTQAFDITKILTQYPNFSTLNNLLTKTQLAQQINSRKTITVLALDNEAISSIAGKPLDVMKKILANHVILDYYDVEKLTKMGLSGDNKLLTTLFQASGQAKNNNEGFLKCAFVNEGETVFGSGVKDAPLNANLADQIVAQPTDISVLQITEPIIAPGIETASSKPTKSPAPASTKAPAQAPTPTKQTAEAPEAGKSIDATSPSSELPEEESGDSSPPTSSAATSGTQAVGLGVATVLISCMVGL